MYLFKQATKKKISLFRVSHQHDTVWLVTLMHVSWSWIMIYFNSLIWSIASLTKWTIVFAVVEGLALLDLGVSPYSGDVFHEVRDPADYLHVFINLVLLAVIRKFKQFHVMTWSTCLAPLIWFLKENQPPKPMVIYRNNVI